MSNDQICDELFISEGTVKTHLTSIYRKFDVNSRTQAVVFAFKNNLLDLK